LKGIIVALVTSTVFLRTRLHEDNEEDGQVYLGALIFIMIANMFNGFAEATLTLARLPVFYKHRDFLFYRPWHFTLPNILLKVPMALLESIIWVVITYYLIGFSPEASRWAISIILPSKIVILLSSIFAFRP
jgi:hypothetical protein